MENPPKSVSRRWWARLRFSIRGQIVGILIVSGCLGWLVNGARTQREAVAAIEKAGGWVRYDWQDEGRNSLARPPWVTEWMVDWLGVDSFGHVTYVILGPGGSDAEMTKIGHLSELEQLDLGGSRVTDAGLSSVSNLSNLRGLALDGNAITDAGLMPLRGLHRLRSLVLRNTAVTDAGLKHLKGLTRLELLDLNGTQTSQAGRQELFDALEPKVIIFYESKYP